MSTKNASVKAIHLQVMWNRLISVVEEQAPRWKTVENRPRAAGSRISPIAAASRASPIAAAPSRWPTASRRASSGASGGRKGGKTPSPGRASPAGGTTCAMTGSCGGAAAGCGISMIGLWYSYPIAWQKKTKHSQGRIVKGCWLGLLDLSQKSPIRQPFKHLPRYIAKSAISSPRITNSPCSN